MMILVTVLLICIPFLWRYLVMKKYKPLEKIPGPTPKPLIGNSLDIGSNPQEMFQNIRKFHKQFGHIFKVYIGNKPQIIIETPEFLEPILNSTVKTTKASAYDLLKAWLGNGLLVSEGAKWKSRRKMITPTFHFKILDQFLEIFNSAGDTLIKKLSEAIGNDSIDIYPYINLFSLDVICETSMGVQIKAQEHNNTEYVTAVRDYLEIFMRRVFSAWERFDTLFMFSPSYSLYKESLKILHNFTNNVIRRRREEKSKQQNSNHKISDDGIKRKVALLDMLLESENNETLTNEDIREEIDTFMFEGHDTTTAGISFTILALADHPEVQEKIFQEIESVIGTDSDTYITMQLLQEMKYLETVVKEVQRFYPSVPMIDRNLEEDCTIMGYDIPKGTTVSLDIYGLHHNPENFTDPQKFDPDRFLGENQSQRHHYGYIPFSAGSRNCIGQKFAMLEMKSTIIKMVRAFRILPVPNFKPELGLFAILKSSNGICVRLQAR